METEKDMMVVADGNGALVVPEQIQTITQELQTGGQDTFSSVKLENADFVTKAMISTALATPEKRLADCVNMTINVQDILIHRVGLVDEQTGEVVDVPRTVLIDTNGASYVAVSKGIYNVIRTNIFPLFGSPTWEDGLPLIVKQGGSGTRKFLSLVPDIKELQKRKK